MMRQAISALLLTGAARANKLCLGTCTTSTGVKSCVFDFKLDVFASSTGYYTVDGCDGVMPTLGMEENVEYTFKQYDATNWMHPLGFAYFADGAHKDVDELEPGINRHENAYCTKADNDCMAPQYNIDGAFVGGASGSGDFGLDVYEPEFFHAREDWVAKKYDVKLTVNDPEVTDFFYFCHIHDNMSGRVKVLTADGKKRAEADSPALGYEYEVPSAFDRECGTFGVDQYKDVAAVCPSMSFVCGVKDGHPHEVFGRCLEAVDCGMHVEMRVSLDKNNPLVTFMHQMIPHHENAVNMAKLILKDSRAQGDAEVIDLAWNIINTQNAQITFMRGWLSANSHPGDAACDYEAKKTPVTNAIIAEDDDLSNKAVVGIVCGLLAALIACSTAVVLAVGSKRKVEGSTSAEPEADYAKKPTQ